MNINQQVQGRGGRLLWSIVAMAIMAVFGGSVASAQSAEAEAERITLSPSSTSLAVDAGQTVTGSMKVVNDGTVSYGFNVYARPYAVSNEAYDPDFTKQAANTGVYKWVQFNQTAYTIEPGQTIEVKYTLRVPADAAPGGHYGVLFAETNERGLEGTGVARKKRVGNLLYITVNGAYKTEGNLKEFILPFWQFKAPVVSSLRLQNTGNADFKTKVTTTAKSLFGQTKFTYMGDPIVLPGTTRLVEMKWEKAPAFGLFKVQQTAEFLGKKHEHSGYVLIAPRWFPITLVLILLAVGTYAIRQKRQSRR
jgi:hypothetical protein